MTIKEYNYWKVILDITIELLYVHLKYENCRITKTEQEIVPAQAIHK